MVDACVGARNNVDWLLESHALSRGGCRGRKRYWQGLGYLARGRRPSGLLVTERDYLSIAAHHLQAFPLPGLIHEDSQVNRTRKLEHQSGVQRRCACARTEAGSPFGV